MAHILLVESPPDDDFTVLHEAARLGHKVTFFTSDLTYFRRTGLLDSLLHKLASKVIFTKTSRFDYEEFEKIVLARHATEPIDAVLCLHDVHVVAAARIAERLVLPFLNAATAQLARDKYSVREALARHGLRQPAFALATSESELRAAADRIGFPLLIKPSDGFGSSNISVFSSAEEFAVNIDSLSKVLPHDVDYGYRVRSNNRFVVERFMHGTIVGCDTFTCGGEHLFLGINEKRFYQPPLFAVSGSCFPCERHDIAAIRDYALRVLDAVNFNHGAAHLEIMLTDEGPNLVELNPRLVGAHVADQVGMAYELSMHEALISLHLNEPPTVLKATKPRWFIASRWIAADRRGVLQSIELPEISSPMIRSVHRFKQPGNIVCPPRNNGDRIARVLAAGVTQEEAERLAETFVNNSRLHIR